MNRTIKIPLSGRPDGKPIHVTTLPVPIHKTLSDDRVRDEIWLYAYNSKDHPIELSVELPDEDFGFIISPGDGLTPIFPGIILNTKCEIKVYSSEENAIWLRGWSNRIISDYHLEKPKSKWKKFFDWIWRR